MKSYKELLNKNNIFLSTQKNENENSVVFKSIANVGSVLYSFDLKMNKSLFYRAGEDAVINKHHYDIWNFCSNRHELLY